VATVVKLTITLRGKILDTNRFLILRCFQITDVNSDFFFPVQHVLYIVILIGKANITQAKMLHPLNKIFNILKSTGYLIH
jgi:hypothetical protein